jgi:hypothetical protein
MNYCNEVESFINHTLSNLRNISRDNIRCSCKSCKNKNILDLDVIMIHLLQKKKGSWRNTYVGLHMENHMFLIRQWYKGLLGQPLVLETCMEL